MSPEIWGLIGGALTGLITFVITRWSVRQEAKLKHYEHVDTLYNAILEKYLAYPQFLDEAATEQYGVAFSGEDAMRYHAFAYLVHNFLESVFDLLYDKASDSVGEQWSRVFVHHARLHLAWLSANEALFEPAYVAFVKRRLGPAA